MRGSFLQEATHLLSIAAAVFFLSTLILAQVQGTTARQVIADGVQCSSTGIGVGRDDRSADEQAELNRARAERMAKRKGRHSFTNKTGGGAAVCERIVTGKVNEVGILLRQYESLFIPFK